MAKAEIVLGESGGGNSGYCDQTLRNLADTYTSINLGFKPNKVVMGVNHSSYSRTVAVYDNGTISYYYGTSNKDNITSTGVIKPTDTGVDIKRPSNMWTSEFVLICCIDE